MQSATGHGAPPLGTPKKCAQKTCYDVGNLRFEQEELHYRAHIFKFDFFVGGHLRVASASNLANLPVCGLKFYVHTLMQPSRVISRHI